MLWWPGPGECERRGEEFVVGHRVVCSSRALACSGKAGVNNRKPAAWTPAQKQQLGELVAPVMPHIRLYWIPQSR